MHEESNFMEIKADKKDLEKALALGEKSAKSAKDEISKEEELGIHKGALNTLISERNELLKMIMNVEAIMQAHVSRLKELGIDIKFQQPKEEK